MIIIIFIIIIIIIIKPVCSALRSLWSRGLSRSLAGIAGCNPVRGIDVCPL
jgi:hypothetical protein